MFDLPIKFNSVVLVDTFSYFNPKIDVSFHLLYTRLLFLTSLFTEDTPVRSEHKTYDGH